MVLTGGVVLIRLDYELEEVQEEDVKSVRPSSCWGEWRCQEGIMGVRNVSLTPFCP